jgi:hypothetical protein
MANWQRTLILNPEWDQALSYEITPQALAASIASKLKNLRPFGLEDIEAERVELVEEFEYLSDSDETDFQEINDLMSQLYDWGDTPLDGHWNGKKVCFIDTISLPVHLRDAAEQKAVSSEAADGPQS